MSLQGVQALVPQPPPKAVNAACSFSNRSTDRRALRARLHRTPHERSSWQRLADHHTGGATHGRWPARWSLFFLAYSLQIQTRSNQWS
jgi:hypothetical protein